MVAGSSTRVINTICPMCHYGCGIEAHVDNGRLLKVTPLKGHPFNRLCVKARAIPELLYSPERITHPLKRVNGNWEQISWDEAFETIVLKLNTVKESYGAKALVTHIGEPFIATHVGRVARLFCSLYGTPNFTTGASLCFVARAVAHGLTMHRYALPLPPSYEGTRCIVVWGLNPVQSNVSEAADIILARKEGAKLIVIDPRVTPLAKRADIYAQIKPGSDCALALGLLNVIITEKLYDREFVEKWTTGFKELERHVADFSPEKVENLTWVSAETIREIARIYATNHPSTIAQGVALDHCANGVQTSRAIGIMVALTGNLDVKGGNVYNLPLRLTSLRVRSQTAQEEAIGARYPLFSRFAGETSAMPVTDAILTGEPYPVKAMIIQGSNPVLTWPDHNRVREALSKLDFLVVSDHFMTETAKLADIFLPSTNFLEMEILKDYVYQGKPVVYITNKAVEPPGECIEDWRIWSEIGKAMGFSEDFPWQTTCELFDTLLKASGIAVEDIRNSPAGYTYRDTPQEKKYIPSGFSTSSGKVEIYSKTMQECGYSPLPSYVESVVTSEDFPLWLITGPRVEAYSHSRQRNLAMLKKLAPEPQAEINTATARNLGIATSDIVSVESPRGSIKMRARVTDDIHPEVVSIPHGWDEANANILTSSEKFDTISGYPSFKVCVCRIRKS